MYQRKAKTLFCTKFLRPDGPVRTCQNGHPTPLLLKPLLRLLIYIYIYMYTYSFIIHILPPFVDDLFIIHYVFIAYSTFKILSLLCIYIYIYLFAFCLLNLFIYLFIYFLRAVG